MTCTLGKKLTSKRESRAWGVGPEPIFAAPPVRQVQDGCELVADASVRYSILSDAGMRYLRSVGITVAPAPPAMKAPSAYASGPITSSIAWHKAEAVVVPLVPGAQASSRSASCGRWRSSSTWA